MTGEENLIYLISKEGDSYAIPLKAARMSHFISSLIPEEDDELGDRDFNVPEVSSAILKKVIEYCRYYQEEEKMQTIEYDTIGENLAEKIKPLWYANYCEDLDEETLVHMAGASIYLGITPLKDMVIMATAFHIEGMSHDELRQLFFPGESVDTDDVGIGS